MAKLEAFAKTADGKKKFGKQLNSKASNYGIRHTKQLSDEFIKDLTDALSGIESKTIANILLKNVSITDPYLPEKSGCGFCVHFNHEALHRDSLWMDGYPNGIDLAYLSNNGYTSRNYVYGNSNSAYTRSLLKRAPEEFIQATVRNFKNKHPNIIIEYNSNYSGGTL